VGRSASSASERLTFALQAIVYRFPVGAVSQQLHLVLGTWWPSIVLVNTVFLIYLALALRRVYGGAWAATCAGGTCRPAGR
jgi:hypothetical protein